MKYKYSLSIEIVERWGLLPSIMEPSYMTGARPDGTLILIRSTGEIVEKTKQGYKVINHA